MPSAPGDALATPVSGPFSNREKMELSAMTCIAATLKPGVENKQLNWHV